MIEFPLVEHARTEDGWRVVVDVPLDTDYVRGHFPGAPIVPAVAQLALVAQAVTTCWNERTHVAGVVDLRFRGRIAPGDRVELTFTPAEPAGELRFRLTNAGTLVSQGIVHARPDAHDA